MSSVVDVDGRAMEISWGDISETIKALKVAMTFSRTQTGILIFVFAYLYLHICTHFICIKPSLLCVINWTIISIHHAEYDVLNPQIWN